MPKRRMRVIVEVDTVMTRRDFNQRIQHGPLTDVLPGAIVYLATEELEHQHEIYDYRGAKSEA